MLSSVSSATCSLIREAAHPLLGSASDYDALLDSIGEARFVLLGEASHGTHEFYREHSRITQRLIQEKVRTDVLRKYRFHNLHGNRNGCL